MDEPEIAPGIQQLADKLPKRLRTALAEVESRLQKGGGSHEAVTALEASLEWLSYAAGLNAQASRTPEFNRMLGRAALSATAPREYYDERTDLREEMIEDLTYDYGRILERGIRSGLQHGASDRTCPFGEVSPERTIWTTAWYLGEQANREYWRTHRNKHMRPMPPFSPDDGVTDVFGDTIEGAKEVE